MSGKLDATEASQLKNEVLAALVALVVLAAVYLVYRAGFSGPFLLDDEPNLQGLFRFGEVRSIADAWLYASNGQAGPLGRLLSLLSFFIDDSVWPSEPDSFKRTNVLIHCLNYLLLFWLLLRLGAALQYARAHTLLVALLGSSLWALASLHVSTVLYVIQRMAMLSTFFVLAGMLFYIAGRQCLHAGRIARGFLLLTVPVGAALLAGVLSKETAVLLPVFLLLIERFLLAPVMPGSALPRAAQRALRAYVVLCLWGTLVALVLYVLTHFGPILSGYDFRPFSMAERLVTEPKILISYLHLLLIPHIQTSALFNENYPVYSSLLEAGALAYAGLCAGLLGAAFYLRRKLPLPAFAVCFFFAGHLLESSVFALELYYEHRNYAPSLFLFAGLVWLGLNAGRYRSLVLFALLAYGGAQAAATALRVSAWSDATELALIWKEKNPGSVRAQQFAATQLLNEGRILAHVLTLEQAIRAIPDSPELAASRLQSVCFGFEPEERRLAVLSHAVDVVRSEPLHYLSFFRTVQNTLGRIRGGLCPGVTPAMLLQLVAAANENPSVNANAIAKHNMLHLAGEIHLRMGNRDLAYAAFTEAVPYAPFPEAILQQAGLLATAGGYDEALALIDLHQRVHASYRELDIGRAGQQRDYLLQEMERLRALIERDRDNAAMSEQNE